MSDSLRTRVTLRLEDLDQSNYAPKPGTQPIINGDGVNLKKEGFMSPPVSKEEYGPIYEAAFAKASEIVQQDPKMAPDRSEIALRLTNQMIAEYEAGKQEMGSPDSSMDQPAMDFLDELIGLSPSAPVKQAAISTKRTVSQVVSPTRAAASSLVWPDTAEPEFVSRQADWLSLEGLGETPISPCYALRLSGSRGPVTMTASWLFQNLTAAGALESIAAVYDKRWDGVSHLAAMMSAKQSGVCSLSIGDIVDDAVQIESIMNYDVAETVWGMEIGDLGLVVFFLTDTN